MPRPHGGKLIDRTVRDDKRERMLEEAKELPVLDIERETAVEVMNIARGLFSPLEGPFFREDLQSVLANGRLGNDLPWTIPILLDVDRKSISIAGVKEGDDIALREIGGGIIGLIHTEELYDFDRKEAAGSTFGTEDDSHPGVKRYLEMHGTAIGGAVCCIGKHPPLVGEYGL